MQSDTVNNSAINQWDQLYHDIVEFNKLARENRATTISAAQAGLHMRATDFFSAKNVIKLWGEIARVNPGSIIFTTKVCNALFTAHRTLCNMYMQNDEPIPSIFQHESYLKFMSDSFVEVLSSLHNSDMRHLVSIIPDLCVQAKNAIALSLCYCSDLSRSDSVVTMLDSDTCLQMTLFVWRIPPAVTHHDSRAAESPAITEPVYRFTTKLLSVALQKQLSTRSGTKEVAVFVKSATKKLLLLHPSSCRMACVIVDCVAHSSHSTPTGETGEEVPSLLELLAMDIACMWAEVAFVSKGHMEMQYYITAAILRALKNLDRTALTRTHDGERSLLGALSRGISAHLNSAERLTRLNGMRVAVAMSTTLTADTEGNASGGSVHFDELKQFREDEFGSPLFLDTSAKDEDGERDDDKTLARTSATLNHGGASDCASSSGDSCDELERDDSSSEDEGLQALYLDEVEGKRVAGADATLRDAEAFLEEGVKLSRYLRECLALLQFSDSSHPDGTYEKQKSALLSVPVVVAMGPADARDNAAPLLKEILRLANSFNIEKFDEIRGAALNSLTVAYPSYCVPILSWAVGSETLTLGSRLEVLAAMARAAYDMSAVKHIHAGAHLLTTSASDGDASFASLGDTEEEEEEESVIERSSKTTIKRPVRLAKLKQRTRYFRNYFGDCAEAFFTPVFQCLLAGLDALSAEMQEQSSQISGQNEDPGLSVLLPALALLSLGAFVKCAVNTPCQRKLLECLLPTAWRLRGVPYLHLRRAAVVSLSDCLEALFHMQHERDSVSARNLIADRSFGTLEYAMNIGKQYTSAADAGDGMVCSSQVAEVVNWATEAIKLEPDIQCRTFHYEIVKNALHHFNL